MSDTRATTGVRYRVQLEGFPAAEFGPADQLMIVGADGIPETDSRPWDAERAWDCYKRRMGAAVREKRRAGVVPVITEVVELETEEEGLTDGSR